MFGKMQKKLHIKSHKHSHGKQGQDLVQERQVTYMCQKGVTLSVCVCSAWRV